MRDYYVTIVRDRRVGWLAGPFAEHGAALAMVEPARAAAEAVDPFTVFDAFGTASVASGRGPRGALNARLGVSDRVPLSSTDRQP
jgi:hypothetical protein